MDIPNWYTFSAEEFVSIGEQAKCGTPGRNVNHVNVEDKVKHATDVNWTADVEQERLQNIVLLLLVRLDAVKIGRVALTGQDTSGRWWAKYPT